MFVKFNLNSDLFQILTLKLKKKTCKNDFELNLQMECQKSDNTSLLKYPW
jgi:hypothetical protein